MRIILLLLIAACFSCNSSIKEKPLNTYYNVDSLISNQLSLLVKKNVDVKKLIAIDGEQELDTVTFDSLGWNNELAVFRIADINKPHLKGLYTATEESSADQTVWRYTTEKPSLGIEYLYVYFSPNQQIEKIEARYNENNALYTSERNLSMRFDSESSLLKSYMVEGSQKMVMKDPIEFKIDSHIL